MGPLLYLCGGHCDGRVLDELWTLNTSTVNWGSKTLELPGAIYERQQCAAPAVRGHAAASVNDQHLVVFGGAAQDGSKGNALSSCDVQKMQWTSHVLQGAVPTPRSHHQMVAFRDKAVVYGGLA